MYRARIPKVYREHVAAQQEQEKLEQREAALAREEREGRIRRVYLTICRCFGYALGFLLVIVIALTGAFEGFTDRR